MSEKADALKKKMIDAVCSDGAWFTTRENCYLKIGRAEIDNLLYARVCIIDDSITAMRGSAYSFGTDWFDISFHGRLVDIYADPDTLKCWDVRFDMEHGTYLHAESGRAEEGRIVEFCRQADQELIAGVRNGNLRAFQIDGTGFAKELPPSEKKMGRTKNILELVQ